MNKLTLNQAIDLFMQSRKTFCSPATVRSYSNTLRYFKDFLEDNMQMSADLIDVRDIHLENINDYVVFLREKEKYSNHPMLESDKKITKRSIRTYCVDMKSFINWLLFNEYIEKNPFKFFKLIKSEKKMVVPISQDIMYIVDDNFDINTELGCRNLAIIHCMIDAGLRSSEVCNLQVKDININQGYIHVSCGKGSKDRLVPLSRTIAKYVSRLLTYTERNQDDYLFQSANGQITKDTLKCMFQRLKVKAGLDEFYPHLLRHTFATSFLAGGGDIAMLKIYMGHEDIKVTENYLHMLNAIRFCKNIYRLDKDMFVKLY